MARASEMWSHARRCLPMQFVDMVCALEPTFGGINLEDIKAPECFYGAVLPS